MSEPLENDDVLDELDIEVEIPASEFFLNNPGYRPCNCEDYPCCGH